ncbi:MAG: LPS export ABC transporter periplasmic protein LptC [Acidobacteria bacterium]|nr:LPS export ABC transporter periplasmic protein LptC [Acidobacteriota bacterium]
MRYQRNLRIGLVLLFIAAVAAVAWSYFHRAYQVYRFLSVPEKLAANVARLAKGFEYTESRDGRPVFKVIASRSVELRQGANILEGVELFKYDNLGQVSDAVTSGKAVYQTQQKLVEFESRVQLRLANGITVRTERLKADLNTQEAEIEDGYTFEAGGYWGQGLRLRYRMKERELQMLERVELLGGSRRHVQSRLKSGQATLIVPNNQIFLQGGVLYNRGEDSLRAGSVEIAYDFDSHKVRELKAKEGVVVTRIAPSGTRTLAAEELTFPVVNGHVSLFEAAGRSQPVRMELKESLATRSLQSALMRGELDAGGDLTALNCSRDVRFMDLAGGLEIGSGASSVKFAGGQLAAAAFSGQVRLEDAPRGVNVRSERLALAFNSAGEAESLEAAGSATLHRAGPGEKESRMAADRLEGAFGPGRTLRSVNGVGNAVLKIQIGAGSVHTVSAGRIAGDFDAAGALSGLSAEQDVQTVTEEGKTVRRSSSDFLQSRLAAGQIAWFRQWPAVRFEEGERVLTGEEAVYDNGALTLSGQKLRPALTEPGSRTTALRFLLYERENRLVARGEVRSELQKSADAGSAFPTFSRDEPVFIQSDSLQLASNQATYAGSVRAFQRNQFLFAQTIVIGPDTGLSASGRVRSFSYREAGGRLKRVAVEAPQLVYRREMRLARYSEGVRMVTEEGSLASGTLDVHFNADNQVDSAVADELVMLRQGDRTGTGSRAQYDFATDRITLTGNLAEVVDSSRRRTKGRRLTFFVGDDRILVEG